MAKEVSGPGRRSEQVETLRAADADRQQIADQLKGALDEGRLSLHEYDERVAGAYAARTYAELLVLVQDLPRPGTSAAEVHARRSAEARRAARRMPVALLVLWTVWASLAAVNLVVYALVRETVNDWVYPWPAWMLVPGVALAAVTVGVQVIRHQQRRR
ncbi:hypothetical protein GCM10010168_10640 [Actinoplanes ianthinogenes]|uniref:DUF1707 domain-containing protein n=1 Tax=Actinoplanes ianthinogenes TaxID=122358 RepID=A0ABM7LY56_9ACTN|nr:DUF1707 domain-containing protein [Actinoplanes ianthinogenes]BCJ44251.1 hypothetical protein Aiant_49080 [Actinoplanes ianthinogenes]GGQ96811.1 hypothetical protein GCM10010168_10640 [Actinoplanes ianthinogenes]